MFRAGVMLSAVLLAVACRSRKASTRASPEPAPTRSASPTTAPLEVHPDAAAVGDSGSGDATPAPDAGPAPLPAAVLAATRASAASAAAAIGRDDARNRPLFKRAARKLVVELIGADLAARRGSAALVQHDLIAVLKHAGATAGPPGDDDLELANTDSSVSVEVRSLDSRHYGVRLATLDGNCFKEDTSLYIVEHGGGAAKLELAFESKGEHMRSELGYAVPRAFSTDRIVIATWLPMKCSQSLAWNGTWAVHYAPIHIRVIRVGTRPGAPKRLFDDHGDIDAEGHVSFEARDHEVIARFSGNLAELTSLRSRQHVFAFHTSADGARRIPPLAASPAGFPDEWLHLPWSKARRLTAPGTLVKLRAWRSTLKLFSPKEKQFGSVGSPWTPSVTREAPDRWSVHLECILSACKKRHLPAALDVIVTRSDGRFRVDDVVPKKK